MKTLEFSFELEKALQSESVAEIERWLRSYKDLEQEMDKRLVYLARYYEDIPNSLKRHYISILLNVLESADCKINTTTSLTDRLRELPHIIDDPALKERLTSAITKLVPA